MTHIRNRMEGAMRAALLTSLVILLALPAAAEVATPYPATMIIETGRPFAKFLKKLDAAIGKNKMGIVARACASCGARSIGVTIPGNRVIMIFRPDLAVRMLKASVAAGIEAPLRIYVTERPDGQARLTYRLPSSIFAPYRVEELDAMAGELDKIMARIVADAMK